MWFPSARHSPLQERPRGAKRLFPLPPSCPPEGPEVAIKAWHSEWPVPLSWWRMADGFVKWTCHWRTIRPETKIVTSLWLTFTATKTRVNSKHVGNGIRTARPVGWSPLPFNRSSKKQHNQRNKYSRGGWMSVFLLWTVPQA